MGKENMEEVIMKLIVASGEAKSAAFEAINAAKKGDEAKTQQLMDVAAERILEAHHRQTALIQAEAAGERTEVTLLMVHAQDHLMTAMLVLDLAREFIDLYKDRSAK